MDGGSLSGGAYEINDLMVAAISPNGTFPTSVTLTFTEAFALGRSYLLSFSGLMDCAGNTFAGEVAFGFGRTPTFNELLITEILADPDPTVGLPEREYLELHNPTNDLISIAGLTLSDATSSTILPDTTIEPGSYLILTTSGGQSELTSFGRTVAVTGFPVH